LVEHDKAESDGAIPSLIENLNFLRVDCGGLGSTDIPTIIDLSKIPIAIAWRSSITIVGQYKPGIKLSVIVTCLIKGWSYRLGFDT
jgi:hypothetical protein